MKKMYSHLYYLFYKLGEMSNSIFLPTYVAGVCMAVLEVWLFFSLYNYIEVIFEIKKLLSTNEEYIVLGTAFIIVMLDLYYTSYKTSSQMMLSAVRENPSKRRDLLLALLVILSIIANLIFSFYLIKVKY